jgi:hypothetical protein
MVAFGLDTIGTTEKDEMRALILAAVHGLKPNV